VYGGAAPGGEDVRLVPPGLELASEPQSEDLGAGEVLGEELVQGEEDLHFSKLPIKSFTVSHPTALSGPTPRLRGLLVK
jgi:hypothetical protein